MGTDGLTWYTSDSGEMWVWSKNKNRWLVLRDGGIPPLEIRKKVEEERERAAATEDAVIWP